MPPLWPTRSHCLASPLRPSSDRTWRRHCDRCQGHRPAGWGPSPAGAQFCFTRLAARSRNTVSPIVEVYLL